MQRFGFSDADASDTGALAASVDMTEPSDTGAGEAASDITEGADRGA